MTASVRLRTIASAALTVVVASCAAAQTVSPRPAPKPTLVVVITIDQMRADYFDRFGRDLAGGLRSLRSEGAFFNNAYHDHAITETAPGHAAVLSGRFPVHTGIVMNSQGVNGVPNAQVIGGRAGESASPDRFRGTTLVDWMRAVDSGTKWLSVSRKDRGAILTIGKSRGDVYWYHGSGQFTTSRYYADTLPGWVRAFNARRLPHAMAGKRWDLLRSASTYPEADSVGIEASGSGGPIAFPHVMPVDPDRAAAALPAFPFMDELTLQFALAGIRALELGANPARTDLVAVSLSATDAVGHAFGPDSRELHDQILRLDLYLGAFLDSLRALRGADRLLVTLTADHGVQPYPTLKSAIYPNADAKQVTLQHPWAAFLRRLESQRIDTTALVLDEGLVLLAKPEAFTSSRVPLDDLLAELKRDLQRVQGVLRVDRMSDLARADTAQDVIARRWLHMFSPRSNVRMIITLTPYSYWLPATYATHGSPHDADAKVPVAFWGHAVAPGQYSEPIRVVDIAPTLAALLGVRPVEALDGRPLNRVLR